MLFCRILFNSGAIFFWQQKKKFRNDGTHEDGKKVRNEGKRNGEKSTHRHVKVAWQLKLCSTTANALGVASNLSNLIQS